MPSFAVTTALRTYEVVVARGVLGRAADYLPPRAGKVFVLTTADVWRFYGARLCSGRDPELLSSSPAARNASVLLGVEAGNMAGAPGESNTGVAGPLD